MTHHFVRFEEKVMENINKKLCSNKEPPTSHDETSSTSSAVSTANIFDLPQVPLLTTFDNIPLLNLLHIDEVCQDWAKLKKAALLRREQLVLVHDETDLEEYYNIPFFSSSYLRKVMNDDGSPYIKVRVRLDRHALYHSWITPTMVDKIIKLMPNLKVLRIVHRSGTTTELWKIKFLLQYYSHQLEEVNIVFDNCLIEYPEELDFIRDDYKSLFPSIFCTLNSMTALHTLELCIVLSDDLAMPMKLDLSVARQLKTMNIETYGFIDEDDVGIDVLKHCKPYLEENKVLQTLYTCNLLSLDNLLTFGPRVSAALKMLSILGILTLDYLYEDFQKFAQKYSHIEDLSIAVVEVPIVQVAKALLSCKALVHLSIDFAQMSGEVPLFEDTSDLPVLPSVKSLW